MKKIRLMYLGVFSFLLLFATACDEDDKPDLPTSALIHYSVVERQVAFTALAHNADSYMWDFGDGETSTDPNPVHVYENADFYVAKLTVNGGTGSVSDEKRIAVAVTPFVLLTGGPNAENGKTWKLDPAHSSKDAFAYADANFTPFDGAPFPLPAGVFTSIGLGSVYEDEYTFHFDNGYGHDVKADGAAFSGLLFAALNGLSVVAAYEDFGLCVASYTPEPEATFTYSEGKDLTVLSAITGGPITYEGVNSISFSGTEFVGFMNFERRVIIQEITDNSMRLVMFFTAIPDAYIGGSAFNTNAIILTFKSVP